ncbi:hypothetical protein C0W54_18975 [Photobacterium kishitanii]|nr:hypothetical protein C0W54_18975 [Photobacterium kishitanii]
MFILNNNININIYIIKSIFLACLLAFISISIIMLFFDFIDKSSPSEILGLIDVFGIIVVSPLIETIIILIIVNFMSKFISNLILISIMVSLFFAILHSMTNKFWGFVIFFPFVVYVISYQVWCLKSYKYGFFVCLFTHAGVNTISVVLMLL